MKPFDLEAAKRGEPVVTRGGIPVTQLAHFPGADKASRVAALSAGSLNLYDETGSYFGDGTESYRDLFMAPRKRKVWVHFYVERHLARHYESEETANELSNGEPRIGNREWTLEIWD